MTQNTVQVSYEDQGRGGRYVARIAGVTGEGELTITKVSEGVISADHTLAPDTMRGTGAATAMVNRLIADARANGLRIIPRCPYVHAQSLKHPEWADVIQS